MTMPLTSVGMAETFIYQTLAADAQIQAVLGAPPHTRLFSGLAPQGTTYPFVLFDNVSGKDVTPLGNIRTFAKPQYQVKGIANVGSLLAMDALMGRVDALLQGGAASFAPGALLACTRIRQIVLANSDQGVAYRQLINVYEFIVSENLGV